MKLLKKDIHIIISTLFVVGGSLLTITIGFISIGITELEEIPGLLGWGGAILSVIGFIWSSIKIYSSEFFSKIQKTWTIIIIFCILSLFVLSIGPIKDSGIMFLSMGLAFFIVCGFPQINFVVFYFRKRRITNNKT